MINLIHTFGNLPITFYSLRSQHTRGCTEIIRLKQYKFLFAFFFHPHFQFLFLLKCPQEYSKLLERNFLVREILFNIAFFFRIRCFHMAVCTLRFFKGEFLHGNQNKEYEYDFHNNPFAYFFSVFLASNELINVSTAPSTMAA